MFKAVEDRDLEGLLSCYDQKVEINEAGSLPYGGVYREQDGAREHSARFRRTWGAFQGPDERRLDPVFFEGADGRVAVLFRHRAVDPEGGRSFDQPEVSIYEVREGRVVRSQMFHADSAAVIGFLEEAGRSADAGESS
jgi:ketosteroid isomerase-like protein